MNRLIGLVLVSAAVMAHAEVIKNPEMVAMNIGTECPSWTWKTPPTAEGSYDASNVYTLTGNGHAIYMCWDRAAFAFVSQVELSSDFTLIGRIKKLPDAVPFSVGVAVKGSADTRSNILDIRFDSYWNQMTWFNRQTEPVKIGMADNAEKGDCQGTTCPKEWEGCLGQGYENRIPDFKETSNIWVRITRQGIKLYAWVKHEDSDTWVEVRPVSAGKPSFGNEGSDLGTFRVFQTGLVYAGFTLATVGYGLDVKSAQFDNIEIRTAADVVPPGTGTTVAAPNSRQVASSKINGITTRDGAVRVSLRKPIGASVVKLYNMSGKQVMEASIQSASTELQFAVPRNLSSGLYQMRLVGSQTELSVPIMLH